MTKKPNTPADNNRQTFTQAEIDAVWEKAIIVTGIDPDIWRKDYAGAWIKKSEHGDTSNELGSGWEIDHCKPVAKGGTDDLYNLYPLQWHNNRDKSDDYPKWHTGVSSEGNKNIFKQQNWKI
jgi:hypothetical protein